MEAGLTELPCWVRTPNDDEVLLSRIVENWQRSDMRPFELADALSRLRDEHGLSQKQLATATGKSEGEISKLLSLLDLDVDIQKTAREDETGLLSKRHLYAIGKLKADDQHSVLRRIQQGRLTDVETEELVQRELRPRRGAPVKQFRFQAEGATVTVTFRRKQVTEGDIAGVLREVLEGVGE